MVSIPISTKELIMNNLTKTDRIALAGVVVAILAAIPAWLVLRPKPEPNNCTYTGRILDEVTQKPINGAKISLDYKNNSYSKRSKSDGFYRFADIPCDAKNSRADVKVDFEGYDPHTQEVQLQENIDDIRLKPKNPTDVNSSKQTSTTVTQTPLSNSSPSPKPTQQNLVVSQPNLGDNLIKNPGFEEGFTGWEQNNVEHRLELGYKSSQAACSIQKTSPKPPQWVGVRQEKIEVKGDQKYRFQAWLSWENAVEVHLKVIFYDRSNNELYQSQIFNSRNEPNSGGWVLQGGSVAAPKNTASALIVIWHGVLNETNVANSKLCIDNVVFTPIGN